MQFLDKFIKICPETLNNVEIVCERKIRNSFIKEAKLINQFLPNPLRVKSKHIYCIQNLERSPISVILKVKIKIDEDRAHL